MQHMYAYVHIYANLYLKYVSPYSDICMYVVGIND